jgi:hypothetical protein
MTLTAKQSINFYDDVYDRYFLDTEFCEDGKTIDLISIGIVGPDGREFYAVNHDAELHRVSPWVREHVLPSLPPYGDSAWQSRREIAGGVDSFIDNAGRRAEIWAYYADYDWVALCQLFGVTEEPVHASKHAVCPECGPHVKFDEDGCCACCGADCTEAPCNCLRELSQLRALVRELMKAAEEFWQERPWGSTRGNALRDALTKARALVDPESGQGKR